MNYSKRIVCLADSKKPGGRCIAGKEVVQDAYGGWIRPVSVRPSAEINLEERQYENGREPQIPDVIEIPMLAPVPRVHQTENHMIDAESYWTKYRRPVVAKTCGPRRLSSFNMGQRRFYVSRQE